jgi:magnesium transporter
MADEQKQLVRQVEPLLESENLAALGEVLREQRASDIAEVVELVDNEQRRLIFNVLEKTASAEVLGKVDEATRAELFKLLQEGEIKALVSELDHDDAADLLAEMPEEVSEKVLSSLSAADSLEIRKLMSYSEDSAGGIMDPVLISVPEEATVAEAVGKIRAAEIDEDFFSVYVVDKYGRFLGDVRVRLLLTAPENTKLSGLVDPHTIYVVADDDQERVRNVFSKNELIAVPVLDKEHRLIGRITADRVIKVAEEEAVEDMYAMAGTDPDELDRFSALHAARIRLTWLIPCLVGTGVTALLLTFFRGKFSFSDEMLLVYTTAFAFVPMIMAISGNAGLQTSTIVVSGLATGHLAALRFGQVFTREVRIALVVALSCALIGGVACWVLIDSGELGAMIRPAQLIFAVGTAMFAAIMVATTLGLVLPFLFRRIGIDPAVSSGPLVTTANDSISVAIYMALTLMLAA